ncbi:hypothetical protein [Amycolatopsis japonica]
MTNIEPWQQPTPLARLDRQGRAIFKQGNNAISAEQVKAVHSAAVVRNTVALGDVLMSGLDQLRRHEARAAADDPMVAEEYGRIRRLVADLGMSEISRYGQRPGL